jgi:hypothetical protein
VKINLIASDVPRCPSFQPTRTTSRDRTISSSYDTVSGRLPHAATGTSTSSAAARCLIRTSIQTYGRNPSWHWFQSSVTCARWAATSSCTLIAVFPRREPIVMDPRTVTAVQMIKRIYCTECQEYR